MGDHVEAGETPEQALAPELKEELGLDSQRWEFFRSYECLNGDTYPNRKFIYWVKLIGCHEISRSTRDSGW